MPLGMVFKVPYQSLLRIPGRMGKEPCFYELPAPGEREDTSVFPDNRLSALGLRVFAQAGPLFGRLFPSLQSGRPLSILQGSP